MERCPLCRALLAGAAMHRLALGDAAASRRLLRRAMDLHATPEVMALWRLVAGDARDHVEASVL
jgi:hypothetical protein